MRAMLSTVRAHFRISNAANSLLGVTTGFGGSADTRTDQPEDLQRALIQHQHSGILPVVKSAGSVYYKLRDSPGIDFMPETWVRGAMLVRCKTLLAGHSAVRYDIIDALVALLKHDLIPLVPLRGSISASGDLQPLSYIAGVLEGNPDCYVWTDDGNGGRCLVGSDIALETLARQSITFGPKEALAILNGTAVSTAVAALAMHEAHHLAILSQVLTAMGVEALNGTVGSFNPFFAKVRPHRGQAEAAKNIKNFLTGSKLARDDDEDEECLGGLKQDRYALRTSSQWIGPQLEDLALAHDQVTIECNSTTDNPLVDVEGKAVHHGGNFQAVSITSAMEKTRLSLQMFGRMLFSQCTELINPMTNNGLPPNLAADEPSTSYTMKGADINVAAYMSELAFLANPVSSHVQTAEMGNQAINSLALISARYTHTAIDCLSNIGATYLYVLCQALDLRAMDILFLEAMEPALREVTTHHFGMAYQDQAVLETLHITLLSQTKRHLTQTTNLDSSTRFTAVASAVQSSLTSFLYNETISLPESFNALQAIKSWTTNAAATLYTIFTENRNNYFANGTATPFLGNASRKMYTYVREELGVPFHKGLVDRPVKGSALKTVGGNISVVVEALRGGSGYGVVVGCLKESGGET